MNEKLCDEQHGIYLDFDLAFSSVSPVESLRVVTIEAELLLEH